MKYKRKLTSIILILILALGLLCISSCGGGSEGNGEGSGGEGTGGESTGGEGSGDEGDEPEDLGDGILDFEANGDLVLSSGKSIKLEGYRLSARLPSGAWAAVESGANGKYLSLGKSSALAITDTKLTLTPASGQGSALDMEMSLCVASGDDGRVATLSVDGKYRMDIYLGSGSIYLADRNEEGYSNFISLPAARGEFFDLRLEVLVDGNSGSSPLMQTNIYINSKLLAKSTNYYSEEEFENSAIENVSFTISNNIGATLHMDDIKMRRTDSISADSPEVLLGRADKHTHFASRERIYSTIIGEEAAKALIESSDRLFGTEVCEWLAALYDPYSGIFYYSNSARDTYGYLPSVDNLGQGMNILVSLGIAESAQQILTEEHKARVSSWAHLRQSNRDGYFYHLHWGTGIGDSRQGRDLVSFQALLTNYGGGVFWFSDANFRLSGGSSGNRGILRPLRYTPSVAEAVSQVVKTSNVRPVSSFSSAEDLRSYLDGLWSRYSGDSYNVGSTIASQATQIRSAGLSEACIQWLNEKQSAVQSTLRAAGKSENGLWDTEVNYRTVSGLLKISGVYNTLGYVMNYAAEALNSSIKVMIEPVDNYQSDSSGIVYVYNPPRAIENILANVKRFTDNTELTETIYSSLKENAKAIILVTEEKLMLYRKADGSFSYYPTHSSETSQGMPAAVKGANEGDVNATSLAFGTRTAMMNILGLPTDPVVDQYSKDISCDIDGDGSAEKVTHLEYFKHLISKVKSPEKVAADSVTDGYYDLAAGDQPTEITVGKSGSAKMENGRLTVTDGAANESAVVRFASGVRSDAENKRVFSISVQCESAPKVSTPYQIFLDTSLKIDIKTESGMLYFVNRYKTAEGGSTEYSEKLQNSSAKTIIVDPCKEFKLTVTVYPEGKTIDGKTVMASVRVLQDGNEQVGHFLHARSDDISELAFGEGRIFSLSSTVSTFYVGNVDCYTTVASFGEYDFGMSDILPGGVSGGSVVKGDDGRYLDVTESTASFQSGIKVGKYNFLELEAVFDIEKYSVGSTLEFALTDTAGKAITTLILQFTEDALLIVHAPSGQQLLSLPHSVTGEITLRLEYHYDLADPELDVFCRYTYPMSQKMRTEVCCLQGVVPSEATASAEDLHSLKISHSLDSLRFDNVTVRRISAK